MDGNANMQTEQVDVLRMLVKQGLLATTPPNEVRERSISRGQQGNPAAPVFRDDQLWFFDSSSLLLHRT
eukprot:14684-Eustigmatos_ZCMA.PRE.1